MYEYLEGRVSARGPASLVLDVGGVGYDLAVPLGSTFGAGGGEEVLRVWTHFVVREDAHRLYGFPDREVRDFFRLLLQVRGVGPGMALTILSTLSPEELLAALVEEDVSPFVRVKGVGKKTAQQILLDLREKATNLLRSGGAEPGVLVPRPTGAARNIEDAVAALLSIGYSEKEARAAVDRAAENVDAEDMERLMRQALRR